MNTQGVKKRVHLLRELDVPKVVKDCLTDYIGAILARGVAGSVMPEYHVTCVTVDVDRSGVVVAAAHLVRVRRILIHPLLPAQLIAFVIEAPIVALLVHQVEHTLVNAPAQMQLEVTLTQSHACPKVAKVWTSGKTHGHIIVEPPPGGT